MSKMNDLPAVVTMNVTVKPRILCLSNDDYVDKWIADLSTLNAFDFLWAHDLPTAVTLARTGRPDLLLLGCSKAGSELLMNPKEEHGDWLLERLAVVLLSRPIDAASCAPHMPEAEDRIFTDLVSQAVAIRLRAVLRRRRPTAMTTRVVWGDLELRHDERKVLVRHQAVQLSFHEFNLLAFLLEAPGKICAREELQHAVWGIKVQSELVGINKLVQTVRKRIAPLLGHNLIEAVPGQGYRLI